MSGIGSAPGILIGFGVGAAASAALEPAFEVPRQQAWAAAPYRILDVGQLAVAVAQGGVDIDAAIAEAKLDGYGEDKLRLLTYLSQTVPGIGEATALWRRGLLSDDLYNHVLVKAGLDQRYVDPIIQNKLAEPLGIGDIALAVVRGILPAPPYVPVPVPAQGDKVPRYPQVDVDPEKLAALLGYSPQALQIEIGRSGLSMAPVMAAQAAFRQIIGADDFKIAVGEGDTRTEWGEAIYEVSRAIPNPHDYVQGQLRGWITEDERNAGIGRHGMVAADGDLMFEIERRPLNPRAVTTGLARGGTFQPAADEIQDPYRAAVHQADLGPEWYDLAIANRYTYPSAFVIRALLEAGVWTADRAEQVLLQIGWPPDMAHEVAAFYAPSGTTVADKHVAKAQTQLWNTTHTSYKSGEVSDTTATDALTTAGVTPDAIPAVLDVWKAERELIRKQLSAAQIKKAYAEGVQNPATGLAWTQQDATTRLLDLGYNAEDAATLLEL